MSKGVIFAREILAQKTLNKYRGVETVPGPKVLSGSEMESWIRRSVVTVHHPAGTCSMGARAEGVVDSDLRLKNIDALCVVDTSVMPDLVSGNINACVVMIAEKASDLIKGGVVSNI